MKITITNKQTGEALTISRSVTTQHPAWVHEQCGTSSESELQQVMDGYNVSDYYRAGKHLGDDVAGISLWEE